jgi:hypothetical protein
MPLSYLAQLAWEYWQALATPERTQPALEALVRSLAPIHGGDVPTALEQVRQRFQAYPPRPRPS